MWNISLSMDTSGTHLQTQKDLQTPAESRQEYLTTGKQYVEPCKIWLDEGPWGKNRSVGRTRPLSRWGN